MGLRARVGYMARPSLRYATARTPRPDGGSVLPSTDAVGESTYLVRMLGVRAPVYLSGDRNQRIMAIARAQRGIVSRQQLLAAGISDRVIHRRLATGWLERIHPGVHAVGPEAPIPLAAEAAALLACGEGAVLSHRTAAAIWK